MRARDLMTPTPTVITADDSIPKTAAVMRNLDVGMLPVVDADLRVVGIVTQADLARRVGPENPGLVEEVIERISSPGALVH